MAERLWQCVEPIEQLVAARTGTPEPGIRVGGEASMDQLVLPYRGVLDDRVVQRWGPVQHPRADPVAAEPCIGRTRTGGEEGTIEPAEVTGRERVPRDIPRTAVRAEVLEPEPARRSGPL